MAIKHRAYSTIEIKAVSDDGDQRIIEGIASTPTVDRVGDIVEPLGAQFKTPMPLLWQHRSGEPVGHVTWAKPNKDGIPFKAKFVKTDEPGKLKDRLDEAWQSVKLGLVRAVSIGFAAVERAYMQGGGIHFLKWEWLELSLVTIPANQEATISAIKSIDAQFRAASGPSDKSAPGASGKSNLSSKGAQQMKTFAEKIAALEAELTPKATRMKSIMQGAIDDGDRALDESEAEEFDDLSEEVKDLEGQLRRLKAIAGTAETAKAVTGSSPAEGSRTRGGTIAAEPVKHEQKGIGFARLVICQMAAALNASKGHMVSPLDIARARYPNMPYAQRQQFEHLLKVAGGTTTDPSWAAPLAEPMNLVSEFVEFLRPMTILGKFGVGGIPSLRTIPFMVKFPAQVTGGEGYWVGEGLAKPVTRFSFEQIELRFTKVANIAVLSEELIRFSNPSAETVVRNALAEALQERLDRDFVDPNIGPATSVRPAAITYLAANSASSGVDAAAVRTDLRTLLSTFITANIRTGGLVLIMREAQALALSLMRNDLGQREFPDITLNGGTLEGIPVITSQYVPTGVVIAVAAPEIYLADDGGVSIDLSREASLEMIDDTPDNAITDGASPPDAVEHALVSLWQTNSVGIRAERMINWQRRRLAAVAYLTGVGWGNEDTSPPQAAI